MNAVPPATAQELLAYLDELGVAHRTVDHPPVYTVAEAKQVRAAEPGGHSKSLFLKNKKGDLWLVVVLEDQKVDLDVLADSLGSKRLSFASPERLWARLGVMPGAVTPFAVINDHDGVVTVAVSTELLAKEPLNFHPLRNDQTTTVASEGLLRFLDATGHPPLLLENDDL